MPNFGGGVGVPVGGIPVPPGSASVLLQPLPYTLLSLSKFAKVMGINPAHFWGTTAQNLNPVVMPVKAACDSVWYQYSWQDSDKVSRYDIAVAIQAVEQEIADALGFWPAPMWTEEEQHDYQSPYRREYYGTGEDVRGLAKTVTANYAKLLEVGRRAVTLIGSATTGAATLVYSDEDSDGLYETATITLTTTETDLSKLRVYHSGLDGIPEWEIREPRSKVLSGGAVVITLDSWLLVDPTLYEAFPTSGGANAIDITTTANFVTAVDVYKEYTDTTDASAEFVWVNADVGCASCGGSGCVSCGHVYQDGCSRISDPKLGLLSPIPASYDAVNGWVTANSWSGAREPDWVRLWYYSGERGREFINGRSFDALQNDLAIMIAHMATARMERPFCECQNVRELSEFLRTDLVRSTREGSFFATRDVTNSAFGTHIGEVEAWRKVAKSMQRRSHVAVI